MGATQRMMVSGKVQAVGYRNWTIWRANALGVSGWVRNVQDGRVEIVACGEDEALGKLVEACRQGPICARVDDIAVEPVGEMPLKGFNKRLGI